MISKTIIVGWTIFLLYWFFAGVTALNEGGASDAIAGAVIMVSMIVHFLMWCAVAIPTYVISRMFSRRPERHQLEPAGTHSTSRRPVARSYE